MELKEVLARVDHTLLRQNATWEEIRKLCDEGMEYGTASVCIPPSFVRDAAGYIALESKARGLKRILPVCTVIGFPNGYNTGAAKSFEAYDAVSKGASEIDMVINIGWAKQGRFGDILKEIDAVGTACQGRVLKVIIETCLLTEEEKIRMCEALSSSYADFIKTSTGFSTGGATLEDIRLFKDHLKHGKRIKASGGIKGLEDAIAFIEAGADRIGTSKVVADVIARGLTV